MKKSSLLYLIIVQLIIIIFLGYNIHSRTWKNSSTSVSVNFIKKGAIIFTSNQELKYFFEPRASTTIEDKVEWLSFIPKYTINSDSLNEQANYSISKPKNTFRIITLGDSFTYGQYVNTEDNWSSLLEKKLNNLFICKDMNKFEVINLGVPGYDIKYSVKRFELRGEKYDPDLVIWFLKDDDFNIINEYFIPKEQELVHQLDFDINNPSEFDSKNGGPIIFLKIIEEIKKELGDKIFIDYQTNALKKMNTLYKKKLLIITFPTTNIQYQSIMEKFVVSRQNGYLYKNLTNIYKIDGLFFLDGHPNLKGHQVIANDLFNYLIKNKIISCN